MTQMLDILNALGWAVVHSLWQGLLILAGVWGLRKLAGPSRPNLAYLAGMGGLILTFAAFLLTLIWLRPQGVDLGPVGSSGPAGDILTADKMAGEVGPAPEGLNLAALTSGLFPALFPGLGLIWAVGFFALTTQVMYGWARTRCLATLGLSDPGAEWTDRFADLVAKSGGGVAICLRVSALVESPVTLGTLKPMVLVPAGFLTGLPTAQVEAILLHEIAHIRRHDFLIGLIQTAIRTTLYFNPTVLIVSRWVSEDREKACDDFAVRHTGSPHDLVRGLAALRLSLAPSPAMAARKGPLLARLERLADKGPNADRRASRGLDRLSAVGLASLFVGASVFASTSWAHPHPGPVPQAPFVIVDGEEIVAPPVPPEMPPMPALPPMPDVPSIPPVPSLGDYDSLDSWGSAMEAWGEDFEVRWSEGESGQDFEAQMEAFGEAMGAWGEQFGDAMEDWGENWGEAFGERLGEEIDLRIDGRVPDLPDEARAEMRREAIRSRNRAEAEARRARSLADRTVPRPPRPSRPGVNVDDLTSDLRERLRDDELITGRDYTLSRRGDRISVNGKALSPELVPAYADILKTAGFAPTVDLSLNVWGSSISLSTDESRE